MEGNRTGRRRAHDHDCDATAQAKRKRKREVEQDNSDSVQILGETQLHLGQDEHAKRLMANGGCDASGVPLNHVNMSRYPAAAARGKERVNNGSLRDATGSLSSLPPNPCESDRMLFVQQWINSIPPDMPLWVQTSLTQVVPVCSTDCYPSGADSDRSSRDECSRLPPGASSDVNSHGRSAFNYHSKPTQASQALSVLCTRYPATAQQANEMLVDFAAAQRNRANDSGESNGVRHHVGYHPRMMSCDVRKVGLGMAPVGRLFDDSETQLVVKLFRDYFTKGSCPILSEVRRRTANTVFEGRRTATSIRAKIKRLQTSGRWTDYAGI